MTMISATLALMLVTQAGAPGSITVIAQEPMSRIEEPRQVAVKTAAEWAALWRQHAGASPAPAVDFAARTVIAVFLGTRTTAGYGIEIVGTREDQGSLIVQWRERRPSRDVVAAQVITSPALIASIPKFDGPIAFEKVDK